LGFACLLKFAGKKLIMFLIVYCQVRFFSIPAHTFADGFSYLTLTDRFL